ncbi:hypothetical protein B566_EDAN014926 [Ephemera danica]|nr:hypothetical protein B566_EDAN014926 [Ephemera danica]
MAGLKILCSFILILLLKWIDRRYCHGVLHYYFKFIFYVFYSSLIALIVLPFWCFINPCNCINSKRTAIILRQITPFLGIKWDVRGKEFLATKQGCIVVMNHQSSLDILGLFWIWRYFDSMAPVAKKEIFYFWPFGLSAYFGGVVFIDRANSPKARKQLEDATRLMHDEGTKLLLFPEGTRNKKRQLAEFKKGAFHMAVTCRVVIEALPLISTSGLTSDDVEDLTKRVRDVMASRYDQLADELRASLPPDYPGL